MCDVRKIRNKALLQMSERVVLQEVKIGEGDREGGGEGGGEGGRGEGGGREGGR